MHTVYKKSEILNAKKKSTLGMIETSMKITIVSLLFLIENLIFSKTEKHDDFSDIYSCCK